MLSVMRAVVVVVTIMSGCFMQEVSCASLRTFPESRDAMIPEEDAKLKENKGDDKKQQLTVDKKDDSMKICVKCCFSVF